MSKIYVDLGCFVGGTLLTFVGENTDFKCYAFDIKSYPLWKYIKKCYNNVVFEKKTAWIEDGEKVFYEHPNGFSSSLFLKSREADMYKPTMVKTFDFTKWIRQFKKEDYIIVKMNIEGAEFDILEKMFEDGSIDYVDELWVAWHNSKIVPPCDDRKENIMKMIEAKQIKYRCV